MGRTALACGMSTCRVSVRSEEMTNRVKHWGEGTVVHSMCHGVLVADVAVLYGFVITAGDAL